MLKKSSKKIYFRKIIKRPWGCYKVLSSGNNFKIKVVEVEPGRSISLQFHRKRNEHWVVVQGKAKVIKGDKVTSLGVNKSIHIPLGIIHRLMNPTNKLLRIVEVQIGRYLGEDDIVRLEDMFGRAKD